MSGAARETLWTAEAVIAATGGHASGGGWQASGISIDSRTIQPGDLFIAVKGETHDGHAFIEAAFARGAAAVLIAASHAGAVPGPAIRVDSVQTAIERLGAAGRARSIARIVAITGSVGKTSTKEALRHVLSVQASTTASAASFNNHIGVPLSLARMPAAARYGVFEIGTNHPGEIEPLARQVRAHAAVITAVAPVHIEYFASVEAIAHEKAAIFSGLNGGTAILDRDGEHFELLARLARAHGTGRLATFGRHADADLRLLSCETGPEGSEVSVRWRGRVIDYRVGAAGAHWAQNSLAVLTAVDALGADVDAAAAALADVQPVTGRGARRYLQLPAGRVELIDESYNASPPSVRAMLSVLAATKPPAGGRRVLVLGDMRELGEHSEAMHVGLAPDISAAGVDVVFTCGPWMQHLHRALPSGLRGAHLPDSAALAAMLVAALHEGDIVAVKGSLGSKMKLVIEALLAADHPTAAAA